MKDKYKYLNRFSKESLIAWMKEQWSVPKESELLWVVWLHGTDALSKDLRNYSEKVANLLVRAEKHDECAEKFVGTNDVRVKLDLISEMQKYYTLSNKYRNERESLDARQKKYDTMYKEIQELKKQGR